MKAQLMPFIILALVAAVTLLGFFVFNTIYGKGFERSMEGIKKIDVAENVIQNLKAYSQLSLAYSSQEAFRESACNGGIISDQPWVWICWGPNILPVEDIKQCAGKFSKYFLNIYLDNFTVELPLEVYKKGVDECSVEVNESDVWKGKYDEGNFWIKCSNVSISVRGKDISATDVFNASYFIVNNRFWYLYRKVAEWAKESDYASCICKATVSCYDCYQAEVCAEDALKKLEEKFKDDKNVKCEWEKDSSCCNTETGDMCQEPKECLPWNKNCVINCRPQCIAETTDLLGSCIPQNLVAYASKDINSRKKYNYETLYFSPEKVCKIWYEHKLERKDVFVCTDHKYYVPSASGPVPLKFTIVAEAGFRVPHPVCEQLAPCEQSHCEKV